MKLDWQLVGLWGISLFKVEKTATIVTVNIPVFNRCFIFTKLCSIIDA